MIRKHLSLSLLILLTLTFSLPRTGFAQGLTDAVRSGSQGIGVGARALSMGGAYSALSDDYSALYFNPAGLGQIRRFELNAGFDFSTYTGDATYLGIAKSSDITGTNLNSLGLVVPIPTYQGSLVFGAGYNRTQTYNTSLSADAFNDGKTRGVTNSITRLFLNSGYYFDLAFDTYAINGDDSLGYYPQYDVDSTQQTGKITEEGGMNTFVLSGAIEAAQNLYVGISLNFQNGNYKFRKTFTERDVLGVYRGFADAMTSVELVDGIETSIAGFNLNTGLLYRLDDHLRLGITVQTPTFLRLSDTYTTQITTAFPRSGLPEPYGVYQDGFDGSFDYELQTPWVFGGALSYEYLFITLAADVKYTDWTQTRYTAPAGEFDDVNQLIRDELQPAVEWHIGGEVRLPATPLRLRAGYSFVPSPYKFLLSNPDARSGGDQAIKTLSFGAGVLLRKTLSIDVAYLQSTQSNETLVYANSPVVSESLRRTNLVVTASFRF